MAEGKGGNKIKNYIGGGKIETLAWTPMRTIKKSTTHSPSGTRVKTITYIGNETEIHRPWKERE